jgi:hypothetical protein
LGEKPNFNGVLLAFPLFVVGIILSVSDDDMVEEVDAHQFAGPLDVFGQMVILTAGREVA